MKKIGLTIIGHFSLGKKCTDGQTIKTNVLYSELSKRYPKTINIVDTSMKKKSPVKLLIKSIYGILASKNVVILLSENGMKIYFPMCYIAAKYGNVRIFHDVIGGNLNSYVVNDPRYKHYLNSFCNNWVETKSLKKRLTELGINNVEVIPNFKRLKLVSDMKYYDECETEFKFCFFSRVIKEKGVEDAIRAIRKVNSCNKGIHCILDIYGPIGEGYKGRFERLLNSAGDEVSYRGVVRYDDSVKVVSGYYGLLFPTYWDGEGFPGTIIDAFSSGVPVIATKWNDNEEIVEDKKTGLLYGHKEKDGLYTSIMWSVSHILEWNEMKANCLKQAKEYTPEKHIKRIMWELKS